MIKRNWTTLETLAEIERERERERERETAKNDTSACENALIR